MSSYTVTTPETSVNLRPSSVKSGQTAQGTATYTVTNKAGATKRTRLRIDPGGGAESGWFTVRDGDERDITPGATASFSIDLTVPGGSGSHSFSVTALNVADTDNDYEQGPTIAFDAPALVQGGTGGGFPWWIVAVAAGLVLLVGGSIWFFNIIASDDGQTPPESSGEVPFHSLVQQSRLIEADEFTSFGIVEIKASPSGTYCAEAVAAVTTQTKAGLTTGTVENLRRCNTVPLSIEFANPVRSVTVEFYGSVQEYPLTAFDASGTEVASATRNGVLIYDQAPPAEITVASSAGNIKRIVFGRDTHGTLIHAIRFE